MCVDEVYWGGIDGWMNGLNEVYKLCTYIHIKLSLHLSRFLFGLLWLCCLEEERDGEAWVGWRIGSCKMGYNKLVN